MMRVLAELIGTIVIFGLFYKGIVWAIQNVRLSKNGAPPPTSDKQ